MPVELCIHTAGPLNNGISSDRIVERTDKDIRASRAGGVDCCVDVGHQIAGPLHAEWIRDRRLEPEYG
jgi:hypothetical protein